MKTSIIIPTYDHLEDCLRPCLESVKEYTEGDVEVLVVANGCKKDTKAYVNSLGDMFKLLWFNEPLSFSKAINEGIRVAKGEYLVFLNNDCILLDQVKNRWLDILASPFITDSTVGITGPLLLNNNFVNRNFIVFFCTMTTKKIINEVGLLDEMFTVGGCEDIDFCIRAENKGYKLVSVPGGFKWEGKEFVGEFPIYHKGETTVGELKDWKSVFDTNLQLLVNKYDKDKLSNNFERAVIGKFDEIPPREHMRYNWALQQLKENNCKKILEIGCGTGYGVKYFSQIEGVDYLGIDYSESVVEYAKLEFGKDNIVFETYDVTSREFEDKIKSDYYDAIIMFEVLEHIVNGKELARRLKHFCDLLLCSVPYKEPVGFWGIHHKLHGLEELDFPDFEYFYISMDGRLCESPDKEYKILYDGVYRSENLMLMKWKRKDLYVNDFNIYKGEDVTVTISTKNRYYTTLPLVLMAVNNQDIKPKKVIIYDDGDHKDLREDSLYQNIFTLYSINNIEVEIILSLGKGQVINHQHALLNVKTPLIWRLDDDTVPESSVLSGLLVHMNNSFVGAAGGLVLDPSLPKYSTLASNKIEDIYLGLNVQWFKKEGFFILSENIDHLYSSFLYKRHTIKDGYCLELSQVGHREETLFTYGIKRNGYDLIVDTSIITHHLKCKSGGIREGNGNLFLHDEHFFSKKLEEWGVIPRFFKLVVLDNGLGDHLVFKKVLIDLKNKYENIIVACCYPEVFIDSDVKIVSIEEAKVFGDIVKYNIYKFMSDRNWKGSLEDAYRKLYIEEDNN